MNELNQSGVPVEAIAKGRDLGSVISSYMKFYDDARKYVDRDGKTEEEIFSDIMLGSVYRVYLLGVEDGMKEERK